MSYAVIDAQAEGFATISLLSRSADLTASFAPAVGMVGCSLRHRGAELLGMRKGLKSYAETGSTMGIPLLHPWANRLAACSLRVGGASYTFDGGSPRVRRDANGLPIHGLLAASPGWQVTSRSADATGARFVARFDFGAHEDLLALFPFPHEILVEVALADATLTLTTQVRATGNVAVPIAFGYHPYFTLPAVPRRDWIVHLPVRRRMRLDAHCLPSGESDAVQIDDGPLGDREFDDLFSELATPAVFTLAGGGRRISVGFDENYPVAVVYAPRDQSFICFEPMTAPTNALLSEWPALQLVQPGSAYRARFTIRVEGLA